MGDNNGSRVVFWVMLLLAWPFFLWQVFCVITHRPMPQLGRNLGLTPIELVASGQVDPAAMQHAYTVLGMYGALFLVITIIAYMNSYYSGRR